MVDVTPRKSDPVLLRQRELSRWENEGGAVVTRAAFVTHWQAPNSRSCPTAEVDICRWEAN
jgi:hypothetical protein